MGANNTYVIDIQISSDTNISQLEHPFLRKIRYLNTNEFKDSLVRTLSIPYEAIKFSAVILSWRGLLYKPSAQLLRDLGLSKFDLSNITLRSMEGSVRIIRYRGRWGGLTGPPP